MDLIISVPDFLMYFVIEAFSLSVTCCKHYCPLTFRRKTREHGIQLSMIRDAWRVVPYTLTVYTLSPELLVCRSFCNCTDAFVF